MHELSLGTWFIHIATLFEWGIAIILIDHISSISNNKALGYFALAMLPNLASAMAAITWHIYDNSEKLIGSLLIALGIIIYGSSAFSFGLFKDKNLMDTFFGRKEI